MATRIHTNSPLPAPAMHATHVLPQSKSHVLAGVQDAYWSDDEAVRASPSAFFLCMCISLPALSSGGRRMPVVSRGDGYIRSQLQAVPLRLPGADLGLSQLPCHLQANFCRSANSAGITSRRTSTAVALRVGGSTLMRPYSSSRSTLKSESPFSSLVSLLCIACYASGALPSLCPLCGLLGSSPVGPSWGTRTL